MTMRRSKRQWIVATAEGSATAGGREMALAADGAINVWLTILIVAGANLPLGYRSYVGIV